MPSTTKLSPKLRSTFSLLFAGFAAATPARSALAATEAPPASAKAPPTPSASDAVTDEDEEKAAAFEKRERTEAESRVGLEVSVRTGVALPIGRASLTTVSNEVPFGLDLGWRISDSVLLGVYGQYAFVHTSSAYVGNGSDIRFGLQVQYHPKPHASVDPWVGLGAGYERLSLGNSTSYLSSVSVVGDAADTSFSLATKGFELVNVQGGVDWNVGSHVAVGPFAGLALGRFDTESFESGPSEDIGEKQFHAWITFGFRGVIH